jgi:MerR family Zn(II)-responsive transcriptional regulator of zntA
MRATADERRRLTVGRLAALADVSANAVRFYEREGLMRVPAKSAGGYRLYDAQAIERLRFIKQAQRAGFTLAEIQTLIRLRDDGAACCGDVRAKVVEKRRELEARIRAMEETARSLDRMIAACDSEARPTDDCPILATLSAGAPTAKLRGRGRAA